MIGQATKPHRYSQVNWVTAIALLIFHTGAPGANGGLFVCDLWESREAFEEFGKVLMPLIEKHGMAAGVTPVITTPYYVYQTQEVEV